MDCRTVYNKSNSELTRKNYLSNLRQFILFSGKREATEVRVEDVLAWRESLGRPTKVKDALNRETKFEYDKLGRRTKRILPMGQTETYSYSTQGNLSAKTDFNGKTTSFNYDNMRRLLAKIPDASLNQPTVNFTYNDLGQRTTMTDASVVTNYSYGIRNRLWG